jgi:hypothetical protein
MNSFIRVSFWPDNKCCALPPGIKSNLFLWPNRWEHSLYLCPTMRNNAKPCVSTQVSQEERSIFWEVTVLVILSKKVYMYTCPIPKGFRDTAISLYSTLYTVQTNKATCPCMGCKVPWCWWWNCQKFIILGKLYQLYHLNNKYWY